MPQPIQLANLDGRAVLLADGRCIDLESRSKGAFTADPMHALAHWDAFTTWAATQRADEKDPTLDPKSLGPCVPAPRQVFGIGLNYRAHAKEAGLDLPKQPMVFTKFPSCVSGPHAPIQLTSDRVDWEIELVVVIGAGGRDIPEDAALSRVAGYCVGQDISDRRLQFSDAPPQFSMGKSARGFGPIGPAVADLSSIPDPDALSLRCDINGETMQQAETSDMIFGVRQLVAYLSRHVELLSGDLIFTGTPAGVGSVRTPRRYLAPGDVIDSEIGGLGHLSNRCLAPEADHQAVISMFSAG